MGQLWLTESAAKKSYSPAELMELASFGREGKVDFFAVERTTSNSIQAIFRSKLDFETRDTVKLRQTMVPACLRPLMLVLDGGETTYFANPEHRSKLDGKLYISRDIESRREVKESTFSFLFGTSSSDVWPCRTWLRKNLEILCDALQVELCSGGFDNRFYIRKEDLNEDTARAIFITVCEEIKKVLPDGIQLEVAPGDV